MLIRLIRSAALVIPALAVCACASNPRTELYGLDPASAAMVRQTCTDIMGLRAGVEFDACNDSLAQSVRALHDARVIARANERCEQQGLLPGTAALATCVVVSKRTEAPPAWEHAAPISVSDAHPGRSYFRMSPSQQDERMELSCAQLGLHPAWGGFRQCVMNLKDAIFTAQNPRPL